MIKASSVLTLYNNHKSLDGKTVTLNGWVRSVRDGKAFAFVELSDGSVIKTVQLVVGGDKQCFETVKKLNIGAAVTVTGLVVNTPDARQPFEIAAEDITVEGGSQPDYPLQKKRHTLEFLRTIPHLRPRTNMFQAVFRIRSEVSFAIHDYFHGLCFVYAHTPIITGADAEGAPMFRVTSPGTEREFFGRPAHLSGSGQLEAETFAQAFGKTYTFGPTFRAENSNTPRHANEFWMIEPEMAFCDLEGDMDNAEGLVKHIIIHILETCPYEMEFLNQFVDNTLIERLKDVANAEFERMEYTEAIELLEKVKDKFEYPVGWGADLQSEHERYISEEICKKPVFLTNYPKELKSFYMRLNDDGKTVACMDLLVPHVGELVGGSQREERYDVLLKRMNELGLSVEDNEWYMSLRKYGTTRHAGYGLGLERMIMYVTGIANIRDSIPFPRTPGVM
ncbi:MAG: asparagine--tRNA ligase [Oscillospiraceae bacterium]|nr:asparagine--tRNA ligase [Oscillospiraceae bacterium]